MPSVTGVVLVALLAQPAAPTFARGAFKTPDGSTVRYGLAVPRDYDASRPRPLVLALHPGGGGTPFYGDRYLRSVFSPGLQGLDAIMIAPDAPGQTWTDTESEKGVMALLQDVAAKYSIDRRRILVVGFSMGGRGAWFLSSRHADQFTAAIVMAGQSDEPVADLARIPTYVIHSRDDERIPFDQAARRVEALERLGRALRFDVLEGVGHFSMGDYADALQRGGRWVRERWDK